MKNTQTTTRAARLAREKRNNGGINRYKWVRFAHYKRNRDAAAASKKLRVNVFPELEVWWDGCCCVFVRERCGAIPKVLA
jgi:hypothetical protein